MKYTKTLQYWDMDGIIYDQLDDLIRFCLQQGYFKISVLGGGEATHLPAVSNLIHTFWTWFNVL